MAKGTKKKIKQKEHEIRKPVHINLLDDLEMLYQTKKFSDVKFIVGDTNKEILAHRLILAASSTIFASMLFPNQLEEEALTFPLEIRIPDVDPVMFEALIECMYTNTIEPEGARALEYISLSKRYDVAKMHAIYTDIWQDMLSVDNVCKVFNDAPKVIGDANFGLEFIKSNAKLVFKSEGFLELEPSRLIYLLKQENICLTESEILQSVILWAKEQVVLQDPDADPDSEKSAPLVKKNITPMLMLIRMPLFRMLDFSKFVNEWNFLSDEDLYELFTYIACKEAKVPAEKMPLTKWSTESRRSKAGFQFKWVKCGNRGTISEDGLVHRSTGGGYCCALGDEGMKPGTGQYYWEIKVEQCTSSPWQIAVGVGTQVMDLNSYMSQSTAGWAYFNHGCRCHNSGSGSLSYGGLYTAGALLGILYDSDEGTLSFWKDGESCGVAFSGITQEVWPGSHVNTNGTTRINDDPKIPDDI